MECKSVKRISKQEAKKYRLQREVGIHPHHLGLYRILVRFCPVDTHGHVQRIIIAYVGERPPKKGTYEPQEVTEEIVTSNIRIEFNEQIKRLAIWFGKNK